MKKRLPLLILLGCMAALAFAVFLPTQTAHAQCGGEQQPTCEPPPCEQNNSCTPVNQPPSNQPPAQPNPTKTPKPKPALTPTPTETPTDTPLPTDTPIEILPTDTPTPCILRNWYKDADADGYGVKDSVLACVPPAGYGASVPSDCNDSNAVINPGAAEVCRNGIDENCDGVDAVCAEAVPAPVMGACVGPDCATGIRESPFFPWLLGLGGLVVGILIGLFIPFRPGSFFDVRPGAKLGAQTVHSPGGGSDSPSLSAQTVHTPGGTGGTVNPGSPALAAREAALNAREAALNVREAALKAREAASGSPGTSG